MRTLWSRQRRSRIGIMDLGDFGLGPGDSDSGSVTPTSDPSGPSGPTVGGGHGSTVGSQGYSTGPVGGAASRSQNAQTPPPGGCVIFSGTVLANPPVGFTDWSQVGIEDVNIDALMATPQAAGLRASIGQHIGQWIANDPLRRQPLMRVTIPTMGRSGGVRVYVVRPDGDPPELLRVALPKITAGSDASRAAFFELALKLWFPDYVLDPQGTYLRYAGQKNWNLGSDTPDGPFPWQVRFVTEAMIQFAVGYMRRPDAFGVHTADGGGVFGAIGSAIQTGGAAGAATKNIYVAAGAAAASLVKSVWSALTSLFGPSQPEWLTELLKMVPLRLEGTVPPTFATTTPDAGTYAVRTVNCKRVTINPSPHAIMTVEEGLAETIRRLRGDSSDGSVAILAALGIAAVAVIAAR